MKYILALVFIIGFFAFAIYVTIYRFKDCKKVGHSTFYCLTSR